MPQRATIGPGMKRVWGRRIIYSLPSIGFMIFLYRVSAIPGDDIPTQLIAPDYVMHAGGYAILAFFVFVALRRGWNRPPQTSFWIGWIICALYGVIDEFHQSFVPGRTADWRDVAADGVGALLALVFLRAFRFLDR